MFPLARQKLVEHALGGALSRDQRQSKRTGHAGGRERGGCQRDAAKERPALGVLALTARADLREAAFGRLEPHREGELEPVPAQLPEARRAT